MGRRVILWDKKGVILCLDAQPSFCHFTLKMIS